MSDLDFMGDDFDPVKEAEEAGDGDFKPLPVGWYSGVITEAKIEDTKAGNGKMVGIRLDVEGPTHAGRVIFDRIIVAHPSEKAVAIGRARFGQLCVSAGFEKKPNDTKALLGKRIEFKLKIERSKEYGDSNRVQAYRKSSGTTEVADVSFDDDDIPF